MEIDKEIRNLVRQKALMDYQGEDRVLPIEEVLKEIGDERKQRSLKTSIPSLDEISQGFRSGNLVVVSAPTGQGKTTFCKTLTKNFTENGTYSIWFSYEVPPFEFYESFPEGNKFFTVPRKLEIGSLVWIENRIIESKAKYNTNVVFIDHLHFLIEMRELAIAKSTSLLIGMILRGLKQIAIRNDMIIFLIAHMKKKDTEEELPTIDDLRDSSFVAQESDMVLLLWRKQIAQSKEEKKDKIPPIWTNEAVISVVKNRRTGKLGYVKLLYNQSKNTFFEETNRYAI